MTPPSQRMTMRGLGIRAWRMERSVIVAASSIFGMIDALTTAVRVRTLRP